MKDDQQWQKLSQQWHHQPVNDHSISMGQIKRRVLQQQLKMVVMIIIEIAIVLFVAYWLYVGLQYDYGDALISWLGFGLIFSLVTTVVSVKQRIKLVNPQVMNTRQWLDHQVKYSTVQVKLARLTQYMVAILLVALHVWLAYFHFFYKHSTPDFNVYAYVFALLWLMLFVKVALRVKAQASAALQRYLKERQSMED